MIYLAIAIVLLVTATAIAYACLIVGSRADRQAEQRAYLMWVLDDANKINDRDRKERTG